jgi:hypothetical protein
LIAKTIPKSTIDRHRIQHGVECAEERASRRSARRWFSFCRSSARPFMLVLAGSSSTRRFLTPHSEGSNAVRDESQAALVRHREVASRAGDDCARSWAMRS